MTINIDALHIAVILTGALYGFGVISFSFFIILLLVEIILYLYIAFLEDDFY